MSSRPCSLSQELLVQGGLLKKQRCQGLVGEPPTVCGQLLTAHHSTNTLLGDIVTVVQTLVKNSMTLTDVVSSLTNAPLMPYGRSLLSPSNSEKRDPEFRSHVIQEYGTKQDIVPDHPVNLSKGDAFDSKTFEVAYTECVVTKLMGNSEQVKAAHLLPHSSHSAVCEFIGMSRADVHSARNGLMLCAGLEDAFDVLACSLLQLRDNPSAFRLKVWDFTFMEFPLWRRGVMYIPSITIKRPLLQWGDHPNTLGDYDGTVVTFGKHCPFRRALSFQAWWAYRSGRERGYIPDSEPAPPEFGSLAQTKHRRFRTIQQEHAQARAAAGQPLSPVSVDLETGLTGGQMDQLDGTDQAIQASEALVKRQQKKLLLMTTQTHGHARSGTALALAVDAASVAVAPVDANGMSYAIMPAIVQESIRVGRVCDERRAELTEYWCFGELKSDETHVALCTQVPENAVETLVGDNLQEYDRWCQGAEPAHPVNEFSRHYLSRAVQEHFIPPLVLNAIAGVEQFNQQHRMRVKQNETERREQQQREQSTSEQHVQQQAPLLQQQRSK